MSDQHNPIPPRQQQASLPTIQSSSFRVIYAGGFAYRATPTDFAITLMTQIPVTARGSPIAFNANVQEAMIVLSLPTAKALARNLARLVAEIEKHVGNIRMTKDSILTVDQIEIISESLEITEYADDEA
jgi:hypothetical protein